MRTVSMLAAVAALAGCAGTTEYTLPSAQPRRDAQTATIAAPVDAVWARAVPRLSQRFFVINNIDKASGLINVSYSGDPERYVDCGRVVTQVTNAAGSRTHDFPASRATQVYESMDMRYGYRRYNRRMELEGRINLVFEAAGAEQSRVTANARYLLTRKITAFNGLGDALGSGSDTISFNSGQIEAFPPAADGRATTCLPTGELERELLEAMR